MVGKKAKPRAQKRSHFSPDFLIAEDAAHYGAGQTPRMVWEDRFRNCWIFQGDSLALLEGIARKHPDGLFDLIFADPPYFLSNGGMTCQAGKMVSVNKGEWDKRPSVEAMHEFNRTWLAACQKVLKPNGSIFVSGTSHVIHSVGFAMQELGYKILNDIIWVKPNPPPNLSCRYFTHATEIILWAAKNARSKHTFDYQAMRKEAGGKQMKSVWRDIQWDDEDVQVTIDALPPSRDEKVFGKHPTQKPVLLLERLILAASGEGDIVLDPFMGSGTTGVAALHLNRKFVGCDLEERYVSIAMQRFEAMAKRTKQKAFA